VSPSAPVAGVGSRTRRKNAACTFRRTANLSFLNAINPLYAMSGFAVGFIVGLTGVGGKKIANKAERSSLVRLKQSFSTKRSSYPSDCGRGYVGRVNCSQRLVRPNPTGFGATMKGRTVGLEKEGRPRGVWSSLPHRVSAVANAQSPP